MKHVWSVLCKNSVIDNESNLISLLDCLEQISVVIDKEAVKPYDKMVFPIDFHIVSFWLLSNNMKDKKFGVKIDLYDPSNNLIKSFSGEHILKKNYVRFRNRMKIQGLPITKEGRYTFKVNLKEGEQGKYKEVAELPLDISIKYKIFNIKNKSN